MAVEITSRAPCRVDLAGGTLDIWPLCLYHDDAVTVNFAVNLYTSCVLRTRDDRRIILRSYDLGEEQEFESIDELCSTRQYKVPLPAYLLRFFRPQSGLELDMNSEAPAGAGISGSSSLIISINSALNRLLGTGYGFDKLREVSQNIESQLIRVPTGPQDYYPAMYGGVSAIELTPAGIKRHGIDVDLADLNERIVLIYTGAPRNSGINNWEVMKAHIDGNHKVHRNFDRIAAIANAMRAAVTKGDWNEVGRLLREEWANRKKNAPGITTDVIDAVVSATRKAGGLGAKACGAGGGGCVFVLAERGAQKKVAQAAERTGAKVLPVQVAPAGVRVKVRQL